MKKLAAIIFFNLISIIGFGQTKIDYSVVINDSCEFFIPNFISYNCNDPSRDYLFRPECSCGFTEYQLTIYNRWGEVLFSTNDPQKFWYTKEQEDGVYIWMLKGELDSGREIDMKGHVTALR